MDVREFVGYVQAYDHIAATPNLRVPEKVALIDELLDMAHRRALTPAQDAALRRLNDHNWRKRDARA
jgi:hypothetical protein